MTTDTSPEGVRDEAPELRVADMLLCRPGPKLDALDYTAAATIQRLHARVQELERAMPTQVATISKLGTTCIATFQSTTARKGDPVYLYPRGSDEWGRICDSGRRHGAKVGAQECAKLIRARGAKGESE